MLPMLTVTGEQGLLYLNGRLAGETGAQAMPLSPDGVQYLELRPFDARARGAVLKLLVQDGRLVDGVTGDVFAVQWPNGWIAMEMRAEPSAIPSSAAPPRLLSSIEMPGGEYLLVDEGGTPSFGRNADEAVFLPVEGVQDGHLRPLPFAGLCACEGKTLVGHYAAILRADDAPEIVRFATGNTVQVDAQGALFAVEPVDDTVGHAAARTFAPDAQGNYRETAREIVFLGGYPKWPESARDTARAWLEAVLLGLREEAAGYLLRPSDQPHFERAVGSFHAVTQLPDSGESGVRLGILDMIGPNLATVREAVFSVSPAHGAQGSYKIEDISAQGGNEHATE